MVDTFGSAWRWEYGTYTLLPGGKKSYFFGLPRVRAYAGERRGHQGEPPIRNSDRSS